MRVATPALGLLLFATTTYAQTAPCAPQAFTYDPYKPSHLAIMRQYGGALLAQAPVSTLLKLDPYVPSQGELLRQMGSGIPLWPAYPWYAYGPPMPVVPDCRPAVEQSPSDPAALSESAITRFDDVLTALRTDRATGRPATGNTMVRASRADRNKGVWIQFNGRSWVSAGAAVPFSETKFVRVGERAGFAVFRRAGVKEDLIFVETTPEMVAPFQPVQ